MSFQNVIDAGGIGLSITGMTIVFASLILLVLFISGLPRVLPLVNSILPEVEGHHGAPMPSATTRPASTGIDEEVVAAIGFALHTRGGSSRNSR